MKKIEVAFMARIKDAHGEYRFATDRALMTVERAQFYVRDSYEAHFEKYPEDFPFSIEVIAIVS